MRTRVPLSVLCILLATTSASAQTVWYVDDDGDPANGCTSWEDACPELQTALSLTEAGDQIWVATGTYTPDYDVGTGKHTGDREATFQLISGVAVYGGFDGTEKTLEDRAGLFDLTIFTGDLLSNDGPDFTNNDENSYHVVTGSGTDDTAILDGFGITAGNANAGLPDGLGGGMLNMSGSPTVRNCKFVENFASAGGGMANWPSAHAHVENCMFLRNSAGNFGGGMANNFSSNVTVRHCLFLENEAPIFAGGGLVSANGSQSTVVECEFIRNAALLGGGAVSAMSDDEFINCLFLENVAEAAGGALQVRNNGHVALIGCLLSGNRASTIGGAVVAVDGNTTLKNCTISQNTMLNTTGGGGLHALTLANLAVSNCILWQNSNSSGRGESAQVYHAADLAEINYTCVEGWTGMLGGVGNIGDNPLFVDLDGDDDVPGNADDNLRLASGSPCIDAADNEAVPPDSADLDDDGDTDEAIPFDLDGNPRFVDDPNTDDTGFGDPPIVDMGVFEFQGGCADEADCEDDNACTIDECIDALCVNTPIDVPVVCDDGNLCTTDTCDPASGCENTPIDPAACDDSDACTTDSCDPVAGCVNTPNTKPCDDGNACTMNDSCDGAGSPGYCTGDEVVCDDSDECTIDSCDPFVGCESILGDGFDCSTDEDCEADFTCQACVCIDPCADDDGDGRVTICHIPPGNPDNTRTILVSMRALPAHLAHGDHCGPCDDGGG
ncbi:MAG: hypothetical protein IID41_14590 [Planctomycetes bacterium]|nr:hypothetical protein [Planctomycetota bacterium]